MGGPRLIRFGLIGAGMIGRLHAGNLARRLPGAELRAIADVDGPAAEACARDLGVTDVYSDYRALLKAADIDAVAVCSPRQTHAPIVRDAAAAGKHIFCEKPLGVALPEIDAALAGVAGAGVKLFVGFNRRFDATYRRAYEAISAGTLGTPRILHLVSRDPELPGADERTWDDVFLDTTVHDFDMARHLAGSEVASVQSIAFADGKRPAEGVLTVLRFRNGAVGTIDNSLRSVAGYDQRVEVFGSQGTLATQNETPHRAVLRDAAGEHAPPPPFFFRERYAASYEAEMAEFIRCLREDSAPSVTGADGRAAVALALAAARSLTGRRPVAPDGAG
ncbi:MAG: Gfo/Idh/MocA family oxidoreductase [Dehalococcoidia bacterium]|nr:Gfo/Idh/MocA family oxidoreductase [Dehalococcoidia bacterium]